MNSRPIRVGDELVPNSTPDVGEGYTSDILYRHFQPGFFDAGHKCVKVETIEPCYMGDRGDNVCRNLCPGRINDMCYGWGQVYLLKLKNQDWDEVSN